MALRELIRASAVMAALCAMTGAAAAEPAGAAPDPTLEEIVVTGTRTPRLRRDSPVRTDVVGETVLTLAAPKNLADALEYLPAVRAESNCQNCNTTEIQLLGLPGAYNQILFDGLPLMSGVAGVYGVEQIPAVLIERIEVVKGGASALYGPGAVAGVVNIIPRPVGETAFRAAVTHERPDDQAYRSGSVAATRAWGEHGLTLYGHVEDAAPVDLDGDGYTESARRDLGVAGVRSLFALGAATDLSLDYQFTTEDRRGGNRLDQPSFLANISEAIDTRQHRVVGSLVHRPTAETAVVATYAAIGTRRNSFYGGLGEVETDPAAPGFNQADLDAAVAISRRQYGTTDNLLQFAELRGEAGWGAHTLIGGIQYRRESVEDDNVDVDGLRIATLLDESFDNLGVFIQDEWSLSERLRLVLGARLDRTSELADPILSPRLGLWWSPDETLVIRANVSTGFRAPEVFSEDLHIDTLGADPVRIVNDPALKEETSRSWSVGFDWRPKGADGAFTLDGQAYLTTLDDTLFIGDIRTAADGRLFQVRENAGGSTVTGTELTATWRAGERLQASLGAAWIDARYDEPQVVFDDGAARITTDRYLKSPEVAAVAQLVFRPQQRWQGFLALKHVGPMDVLNNRTGRLERSPHFIVADLSATRHIPVNNDRGDVDVTLGVKNLFDERQTDLEVGAGRDSDYVYGPRSPRTVFIRLDAHF